MKKHNIKMIDAYGKKFYCNGELLNDLEYVLECYDNKHRKHLFWIYERCPFAYCLYATEVSETKKQDSFYEFMVIDYDEDKGMDRLYDKIERGINIETVDERFFRESGSIFIDEGRLMVDGKYMDMNEFIDRLEPYCSFRMDYSIVDKSSELLDNRNMTLIPVRTDNIVEELEELSKRSLEVFKYGFPFIVTKFIYSVKTLDERKKKGKAMLKILENMTGVVEETELFRRVAGDHVAYVDKDGNIFASEHSVIGDL